MPRRNSPNDIRSLGDLSRLAELVVDKRQGQRAAAKKNRRNRMARLVSVAWRLDRSRAPSLTRPVKDRMADHRG